MTLALFAPQARRDLRGAIEWIVSDNPQAAAALLESALRGASFIARNPLKGSVRPDVLPPPFRFWPLRGFPYLLVYNAGHSPPRVLRLIHMARDLPTLLGALED